jgi:hypothetical protein
LVKYHLRRVNPFKPLFPNMCGEGGCQREGNLGCDFTNGNGALKDEKKTLNKTYGHKIG